MCQVDHSTMLEEPAVEVLAERLIERVNHASVPLGTRRASGRADGFDARELVETASAGLSTELCPPVEDCRMPKTLPENSGQSP
jgi:hypothetical protein